MLSSVVANKTYSIKGDVTRKQVYTICNFPFSKRQETGIKRGLGQRVANRKARTRHKEWAGPACCQQKGKKQA